MDSSGENKCCAVPLCQNRTSRTPEKVFIPVPFNVKKRNLWLRLAKRNPKKITGDAKIYFCEDHFDLETDVTNYLQYKMGLTQELEMVPGCIPTKFKCQMNHKLASKTRNIVVTKKLLDLTEEQKKQSEAANSSAQSIADIKIADVKSINIQEGKSDSGVTEKMDQFQKVFSTDMPKSNYKPCNNLYELLKIVPAKPVVVNETQNTTCNFTPNTDKYYIPKKKSRLKVITVSNIRKAMEHDVYNYLPKALDNQKNNLLKKIMDGSSRGETTQSMFKKMLSSDQPILKSSWQMLMNINPENHQHSKQFVLWNGKSIQINGSRGGRNKFIWNYDLGSHMIKKISSKKKIPDKKKGLLQSSLAVRFKPGPLRWKKYLDDSYQKHHVGFTELVHLPKAGLDIQPFYGMTLEPGIAKFVNSLREESGRICKTWAEFAVTMLGSINKSNAVQNNPDTTITFDLNYKCNQRRLLMRRDLQDRQSVLKVQSDNKKTPKYVSNDLIITSEVKLILEKIVDSVEISLEQENIYTGPDEPREIACQRPINMSNTKEKTKKRCSELGRLDVTVIRLPEDNQMNEQKFCNKPFCTLGCVCASIECSYTLKPHCGLVGCMFQCNCDFSRFKDADILKTQCSDFLPGLINLDSEINLNLAKEEQKFRQTVIVSGEKSILLKSQKRNWKASKKYADFYTNLNLKANKKAEMALSIVGLNLNCQNIEPWCMVHNLYKCFCKGKFTETSMFEFSEDNAQDIAPVENIPVNTNILETNNDLNNTENITLRDEAINKETNTNVDCLDSWLYVPTEPSYTCARVKAYKGRKYNSDYYKLTNNKIRKMEQNDAKLKKRLTYILNKYAMDVKASMKGHPIAESCAILDVENGTCDKTTTSCEEVPQPDIIQGEPISKSKLVAWLESSYKLYKYRMNQGIQKTTLEPPVSGRLALYTWEFILKRYKQKKNFFMVNKKDPFRIFIAVDGKSSFFDNCININNIELADLHKFPSTVKNLLTDACDTPEDFCILCGWTECWEIIGSVSKLNDKCEAGLVNENVFTANDFFSAKTIITEVEHLNYKDKLSINCQSTVKRKRRSNSESSKWFLMTVENDFNEIQFHTRGFFVSYSSIIRAINVARKTGKTVRLSSQKCAEKGSDPQFGIYAIPDSKEYCVFVGPYEIHEPLGIETVVNSLHVKKNKKTRGVWITTDKVDNGKVIDNPLSYMPFSHTKGKHIFNIDTNDSIANADIEKSDCSLSQMNLNPVETSSEDSDVAKTPTKCMKPIKIRKTQDFYHIASNGALKKIFYKTTKTQGEPNIPPSFLLLHHKPINDIIKPSSSQSVEGGLSEKLNDAMPSPQQSPESINLFNKKSEAEPTPQLKISAVFFTRKDETPTKKPEKGMFILKPEEINQRVLNKKLDEPEPVIPQSNSFEKKDFIDMDIENFLNNSVECRPPEAEVLEISDDSGEENEDETTVKQIIPKDVWIQCTNIDNFGWIKGLKNNHNWLSFEFPGFKPTDFYEMKEAFLKINQVLSRKVYITKNLIPEWEIIESESKLKNKNMLDPKQLGPDFVLTKHGIRHKQDVLIGKALQDIVKPDPRHSLKIEKDVPECTSVTSKVALMNGLEEQSDTLENENKILWNKTLSNKAKILQTLSTASEETKQDMTDKLKTIMSMNE